MKKHPALWSAVLLVFIWAPAALSQQGGLTPNHVERFLGDFPGYVELLKEYGNIDASDPAGYVNAQVTAQVVIDYLEDRGWSPEDFAVTTSAILRAFSALLVRETYEESSGEMAEGRRQMEEALRDPNMPAEAKAAIRAQMESMGSAQQFMQQAGLADVPPGDLAVVAPYRDPLQELFDSLKN